MAEQGFRGGCACGKITFKSSQPLGKVTYCYCKECAKVSGAGFIAFAAVEQANTVEWSTEPDVWESSKIARREFCASCGSTLAFIYLGENGGMGIPVGAIDYSAVPLLPRHHVFVKEKEPWVVVPDDGQPRFEMHETAFQVKFDQWKADVV